MRNLHTNAPDLDDARRFLDLLDPRSGIFAFQTIDDVIENGRKRNDPALVGTFHDTLSRTSALLTSLNQSGAGILVCINATDGMGRKRQNIDRVRAVWSDLDGARLRSNYPLSPSIVVETSPGKFHVYWLVADEMNRQRFDAIMHRLVADYDCDPSVRDLARVLRLPGFWHCKHQPFLSRIAEASGRRYSTAELVEAFPPPVPPLPPSVRQRPRQHVEGQVDADIDEIRAALEFIPAVDRHVWLRVGMALHDHFQGSEDGYDLWTAWSLRAPEKFDARDQRRKWNSFRGRGVTIASLFALARLYGADLRRLRADHADAQPQHSSVPKRFSGGGR